MFLLFDIGGTNTRLASSDGESLVQDVIFSTPPAFEDGLKILEKKGKELLGGAEAQKVAGGIAGRFAADMSGVAASRNLRGWENKNLKGGLEKIFNCPAVLQNDAAVGALGEARFGAGKGYKIICYLTVGTGVGGARVVDGKIDISAQGFEPGKQIINLQTGESLEEMVSGAGLQQKYGVASADQIKNPAVWDEAAKIFALGLNNSAAYWSPEIIIAGGSVINEWGIDLEKAAEYLQKNTKLSILPKIVKGELGNKCGLYGAMVLAKQEE